MKSVINKEVQTLFLYKNAHYSTESKYNIILSPEFYWCRVFDIPVNSKKQIKKILPTLFEDILPHSSFEYHAIKLKNKKFICFAYDSNEIIESIKKTGLNILKLQNIYFAQTELVELAPFKIENQAYILKGENLIQLPIKFISEQLDELNTKNINLSKHKIKLNIHQNLLSLKNTYTLSTIFFIIAIINFVTFFSLNSEITNIEKFKQDIIKEKNLPKTSIQLNSIVKSLNKTNKSQLEIRALLNEIFDIHKKNPNSKIVHIQYNKKIFLEIENISFNSLKNSIKSYEIKQVSYKNNILKVEISL